jgi:hypothetical protein
MAEERLKFVEYKGKKILVEDFSNINDEEEFIALLNQAEQIIHSQPPKSVLAVVDLKNARFSPRISEISKEATESNTPYIRASAMVGVSGLMGIMVRAISRFARRDLVSFNTREEAMEWLIQQ